MPVLPHSEACERNKQPIADVLRNRLAACSGVLEIGSGTGQHAVYFAAEMPHLVWQPTEQPAYLADLSLRTELEGGFNLRPPRALDVTQTPWPSFDADAVFTANTLHIMAWDAVRSLISGVGRLLPSEGLLCVYGPFLYDGEYTSPSNAEFDRMLKARDAASGLRDIGAVESHARDSDLVLDADHEMPAFNRLLVFVKRCPTAGAP